MLPLMQTESCNRFRKILIRAALESRAFRVCQRQRTYEDNLRAEFVRRSEFRHSANDEPRSEAAGDEGSHGEAEQTYQAQDSAQWHSQAASWNLRFPNSSR